LILVLFRLEEFTDVEFAVTELEGVATVADLERVVREAIRAARDSDEPEKERGDQAISGVHELDTAKKPRAAGTK
jgi:hypothetical protein